ncbi:MAG: hypothetical protein KDD51_14355 [Bdellovibrionales bacterium]|nr:hypothetical protein [Bdellovibrionales bacterium]
MEPILHAIEGPFTYVVIAEVSVICALFLALVYLIVKRTLQPVAGYSGVSALPQASLAVPAKSPETEEKVEANVGSKGALEPTEEELLKKGYPDVATYYAFKDKIKYLESKLLEYEILQEEIGTLSGLKMENEHLKNKLDSMEKQIAEAKTKAAPVSASPPPPASVPANVEKKSHSSEADLIRDDDEADKRQQKPADPTTLVTAVVANQKEISAPTDVSEKKADGSSAKVKSKPKSKNKHKSKVSKKAEKEPDAKMDSGTSVEGTGLEPTLPGKSAANTDGAEPTALGGQSPKVEAAAEPNDEPPSLADQPDGSPVLDDLIEQLDQLAQEKKAEKDKKKAG